MKALQTFSAVGLLLLLSSSAMAFWTCKVVRTDGTYYKRGYFYDVNWRSVDVEAECEFDTRSATFNFAYCSCKRTRRPF